MRLNLTFCMLMPVVMLCQNQRPDRNGDEAAIRELIAHPQQIKETADCVSWSGGFPRPLIGSQRGEPFPSAQMDKRKNASMTLHPERIEVAASGDMAYEFSYGKVEWDLEGQPVQHIAFENAVLRVWKKVQGEWRVAAMFGRPLDRPFASPPVSR